MATKNHNRARTWRTVVCQRQTVNVRDASLETCILRRRVSSPTPLRHQHAPHSTTPTAAHSLAVAHGIPDSFGSIGGPGMGPNTASSSRVNER